MRKSMKHIICSGVIGCFFWIIGELLYKSFTQSMWQPMGIACYFTLFAIVMIIGMFVLAIFRGDYNKLIDKGRNPISDNIVSLFALLIIFFISTGIFEYLYEIGKTTVDEPTSYVFLIDDSGSMSSNDPNCERAVAIKRIMEKQDATFPYAVYKFTNQSSKIKDMSPYQSTDEYEFESNGGTNIIGSINEVIDDLTQNGQTGGASPRIMLVSDGSSSSMGVSSVIKRCNDNNISISSISFGNLFGNALLSRLSTRTGGVYVGVDNVDQLYDNMQTVITSSATRNLISERFMFKLNWLYALMRILFLTIMALLWALMKNIAYCGNKRTKNEDNYSYENVVMFTLISAIISIIIMEFGIKYIALPEKVARLILAICWMIIPGEFFVASKNKANLTGIVGNNSGFVSNMDNKTLQESEHTFNDDKKTLDPGNAFQNPGGSFGQSATGFSSKGNFGGFSSNQNTSKKTGGFGSANDTKSNTFGSKDSSGTGFGKG